MSKPIPVRLSDELIQQIDRLAERLGYTRSAMIRYILRRALGDPAVESALAEEVIRIHAALQPEMQAAYREFQRDLTQRLREGVSRLSAYDLLSAGEEEEEEGG